LAALVGRVREAGVEIVCGAAWTPDDERTRACDHIVDCRGMGARDDLPALRGVRGEMLVIASAEGRLSRPVRLLHPRFPLYIVPWGDNRFMIGATVIESGDAGPVTVRSALDLLGAAYTVNPAYGEARIETFGADVRPAFPDNAPHIVTRGRIVHVNGLYRHGFLLAPVLAGLVARYIREGVKEDDVFVEDHGEWRAPGMAPGIAGANPG
jgi:glycine oxidase